jgi:hypothetical protein
MSGVPATDYYYATRARSRSVFFLIEFVVFLLLKAYLFSPAWLGATLFFGFNEWLYSRFEVRATHSVNNSSCAAQLCTFNPL